MHTRTRVEHDSNMSEKRKKRKKNPPDEQLSLTQPCVSSLRTSENILHARNLLRLPCFTLSSTQNGQKHKEGDMGETEPWTSPVPFIHCAPAWPSQHPHRCRLLHSLDSLGLLLLLGGFATHNKRQRKNTCNTHECQRRTRQEQPGSSAGSFLVQSVSPDRLPARALGPQ